MQTRSCCKASGRSRFIEPSNCASPDTSLRQPFQLRSFNQLSYSLKSCCHGSALLPWASMRVATKIQSCERCESGPRHHHLRTSLPENPNPNDSQNCPSKGDDVMPSS